LNHAILKSVFKFTWMIVRNASRDIEEILQEFPAVAILGPRQVGKTTLALDIAGSFTPKPIYLDLEDPADLAKLEDPADFLERYKGVLVILDEIQRVPELFPALRGIIDRRRREGYRVAQFLILGSASLDLLQQSSETLAGRIAYKELNGLDISEVGGDQQDKLWIRGGFPGSFLAGSDTSSLRWRSNFITTFLERDISQFAARIPAVVLRRLWTMLAHDQGGQVNFSQLGGNLGISSPTARSYVELLEDLLLVRTLRPWFGNIGKRLVKAPKVYIRDSGITHALLGLRTIDDVLGHPVIGKSWEGFVIENLLSSLREGITAWYYRTANGAEIDLVIEKNAQTRYAIEIKRSTAPTVSKGFHLGCEDIKAVKRFVVYPGSDRFNVSKDVTAISCVEMMKELAAL